MVLCTANSCRSQMAEAYLRHFAKFPDIYSLVSKFASVHTKK
ncbi:MAG TPA: hypothetical protein PKD56_06065 [Chitinophagales bacterium]|nr:hypothetical protein [Chitinophagales bacterium]